MPPLQVIIAVRAPMVRFGLRALLAREPDLQVAAEADDGRRALEEAAALGSDILLLDTRSVDEPWEELVTPFGQLTETRVLLLCHPDDRPPVDLLAGGRVGCVLIDEEPGSLLRAIRELAEGDIRISPRLLRQMLPPPAGIPPDSDLTRREREVLSLLACGYDNRRIADSLFITHGTVKNHLSNIYEKLGVRERGEAVAWAWRSGLAGVPGAAERAPVSTGRRGR